MKNFIKSLKRPDNEPLIEAILKGYSVIFENNESADLMAEERKYKTADEFVKARKAMNGEWMAIDKKGNVLGWYKTEKEALQHKIEPISKKEYQIPKEGDIFLYRGTSQASPVEGHYYTLDKEYAIQFTQSGKSSEVQKISIPVKDVYKAKDLPDTSNPEQMDKIISEASKKGYKAIFASEGGTDKPSIFFINKLKKQQHTDIWNKAQAPSTGEARKYKTADEFVGTQGDMKVASWFSGTGTLEVGLGSGAKSVHAVEYDPKIMEQFNKTHGTKYPTRDVSDVEIQEIINSKPDVFHSSPMCKNFSSAKTLKGADESDRLAAENIAKVINKAQPPVFTLENVPAYQNTALFGYITKALDNNGYKWDVNIINAADYGGNQHRKRLILRAIKNGNLPPLPDKTGSKDWYESIQDLIGQAENTAVPQWEMERINSMIDRGILDPNKPIITMGGAGSGKSAAAVNAGNPAPTLTSTPNSVPRIIIPDGTQKKVTPRMMSRLMGLPDNMSIPENFSDAKIVLGNGIHGVVSAQIIKPLITNYRVRK